MRISDWSSDVCSSDLARLHALNPFGRLGLELLDDLIDRRLPVAEIGALRECAGGREQCECRDAEQDGSGFPDDGLHDDLRWAGGSAIGTDWMKEHTAAAAGTRALAIRDPQYFQAMPHDCAASVGESIGGGSD